MNKNKKIIDLLALLIFTISLTAPLAAMESKNENTLKKLSALELLQEIQKKNKEKFGGNDKNNLKIEKQDNACICQDGPKEQIKKAVAGWLKNVKKMHQCPICMEQLENAYYIAQHPDEKNLAKKHPVHASCIYNWSQSLPNDVNNGSTCIVCHDRSNVEMADMYCGHFEYAFKNNEYAMNKARDEKDITTLEHYYEENIKLCKKLFGKLPAELQVKYYEKMSAVDADINPKLRNAGILTCLSRGLPKTYWRKLSIEEQVTLSIVACSNNMTKGFDKFVTFTCENLKKDEQKPYLDKLVNSFNFSKNNNRAFIFLPWMLGAMLESDVLRKTDSIEYFYALILKQLKEKTIFEEGLYGEPHGVRLAAAFNKSLFKHELFEHECKKMCKDNYGLYGLPNPLAFFEQTLPLIDEDKKESFKKMFGSLPKQNMVGTGTGNIVNDNTNKN